MSSKVTQVPGKRLPDNATKSSCDKFAVHLCPDYHIRVITKLNSVRIDNACTISASRVLLHRLTPAIFLNQHALGRGGNRAGSRHD